jgi:hypothetical protein
LVGPKIMSIMVQTTGPKIITNSDPNHCNGGSH